MNEYMSMHLHSQSVALWFELFIYDLINQSNLKGDLNMAKMAELAREILTRNWRQAKNFVPW